MNKLQGVCFPLLTLAPYWLCLLHRFSISQGQLTLTLWPCAPVTFPSFTFSDSLSTYCAYCLCYTAHTHIIYSDLHIRTHFIFYMCYHWASFNKSVSVNSIQQSTTKSTFPFLEDSLMVVTVVTAPYLTRGLVFSSCHILSVGGKVCPGGDRKSVV